MKKNRLAIVFTFFLITFYASAQFPIVLESENAKLFGDLKIGTISGFSGGKYVHDFIINNDSYYLYENVEVSQAGTYEFCAYSTGSARPFSVKVNQYERKLLWSKDSKDWNAPPTSTTSTFIYLDAGTNVIRIGAEMENGPNFDKFEIHRTSMLIPQPSTVSMAYPSDFTDNAIVTAEHPNSSLSYLTDNDERTYYELPGLTSTTITVDCKEPKLLTSMLLSGGRGVAVNAWKFEYSTDGTIWKRMYFTSYKLVGMGDMTLFTYSRASSNASTFAARYYRLTATGTAGIKIAEWQLFGIPFVDNTLPFPADITDGTIPASNLSGSPMGKSGEMLSRLFDRKMDTKYCADSKVFYVQYQLDQAYRLTSYCLSTANDSPERDPKLWSFSGYNPEEGWIELDERTDMNFPGRYTTQTFPIYSDKEFTAFMLEVSSIKAGSTVQLGNLQVFGNPTGNPAVTPETPNPSGSPAERAATLVRLMTKSEKLSYVGGIDWMYTKDIPRLGIPRMKMSDGPQGLGTWGASTAYPCALLLAASWNEPLAWSYGESLALDCRARGVNILLGPGVNIHRAPMCGRNFEYMGEDPYLTSRTAVGYIKGLQDNGVMGVIKHFTANFQEYDRNYTSSDIDKRTLNEIYFPAFKAAVQEAKVGSVMSSYNLLNGIWTTHDPWLLRTVLRDQWGFKGILMSDWGSTHTCLPAAKGGLDLEMAGGEKMNPDSLRYYLRQGSLSMQIIDEKVYHILETMLRFGFMDKEQTDPSIPLDNPYTSQTALKVAREGMVLLKNENNILPLKPDKIKKVVVIGRNAGRYVTGGGSGRVDPIHYVSFYEGIATLGVKKGIEVNYIDEYDHMDQVIYTSAGSTQKGFTGEYFNNVNLQGTSTGTRTDRKIDFNFQTGTDVPGIGTANYSIRWTGELRPQESGEYTFTLGGDDGFRLYINGTKVIDDWNDGQERYKTYKQTLTAGNKYQIKVEYYQGAGAAVVDFYWSRTGAGDYFLTTLNEADAVIACIGHDASTEAEAGDRTFDLPSYSKTLISKAIQSQTPVIAVVNAGGNVEMQSWEPLLKGLLWAWYAGQEGGTALAEILFGDVNPSGKLPVTFEKKWSDNPVYNSYYDSDGDKHVQFTEGIFMGYRGYDKLNRTVQYPFGYGLSYTTFNLSELTTAETTENNALLKVTCELKNTGSVAGAQVVQLYVGKKETSPVERPVKELKAYKKVYLEPGETQMLTMYLPKDAFSYFDADKDAFVVDEGKYELSLGFSSKDIRLTGETTVKDRTSLKTLSTTSAGLRPSIVNMGEPVTIGAGIASDIRIYDPSGMLRSHQKNSEIIATHSLSRGMYIAHMNIADQKINGKFLIK